MTNKCSPPSSTDNGIQPPSESRVGSVSTTETTTTTTTTMRRAVDSERIRRRSVAVNGRNKANARDIIQHVPDILRASHSYENVTEEQIERIRTMHKKIELGAKFTFNYNTLLFVASVLAALGLVSNSSTTVIASMLVSPIMGPVVGMAYGATIYDWKLCRKSLRTETISLLVCILTGSVIGACTGWTGLGATWPTQEMVTRATLQNFLVGLPIAFFSGLGVAVSVLDDSTSSLVGVAISASLLPPAVNAGILWVAYGFSKNNWLGSGGITPLPTIPTLPPAAFITEAPTTVGAEPYEIGNEFDDDYIPTKTDFRNGGMISLGLTLANIVLVIVASIAMFRIKERLPIEKKVFWDDLGVARKIFRDLAELSEDGDLDGFHLPAQLGSDDHEDQRDDSPRFSHDLDEHSNEMADDPEDEEKPRPKSSKRRGRKKRAVSRRRH